MAKARYAARADRDVVRIASYIAKDNPTAALRWVDAIEGVCALLAAHPDMAQRVQTKQFGEVHRHVAGNYLVYYRPIPAGVEILTIKHAARDQGRL